MPQGDAGGVDAEVLETNLEGGGQCSCCNWRGPVARATLSHV